MLVAGAGEEPALLDFFVQAPRAPAGRHARPSSTRSTCHSETPPRSSTSGRPPAGSTARRRAYARRYERWGTISLERLAAPAARVARDGVALNAGQAYVAKILTDLLTSTPECAALWAPDGHVLREGELLRNPELGDALDRLGADGAEPFYRGRHRRSRSATGCGRAAAR